MSIPSVVRSCGVVVGSGVLLAVLAACQGPEGPGAATPAPVRPPQSEVHPAVALALARDEAAGGPTLAGLQEAAALRDRPEDGAALARAFVSMAREHQDPGYWLQAEGAARLAREVADTRQVPLPAAAALVPVLAAVQAHRFRDAVELARKAAESFPADAAAHGALGDALAEWGEIDAAEGAWQAMMDRRPDQAAWMRAAWARWLRGDAETALAWLGRAASMGGTPVEVGFTRSLESWMALRLGDAGTALKAADRALLAWPDCAVARSLRGRALAALGRTGEAETSLRAAMERVADPETAWALGDLLAASGRPDEAATQYTMVERLGRTLAPRVLVLFLAERGSRPEEALALARAESARRHDPYTLDALALALYRAGEPAEAADRIRHARRWGLKDPMVLRHERTILHGP